MVKVATWALWKLERSSFTGSFRMDQFCHAWKSLANVSFFLSNIHLQHFCSTHRTFSAAPFHWQPNCVQWIGTTRSYYVQAAPTGKSMRSGGKPTSTTRPTILASLRAVWPVLDGRRWRVWRTRAYVVAVLRAMSAVDAAGCRPGDRHTHAHGRRSRAARENTPQGIVKHADRACRRQINLPSRRGDDFFRTRRLHARSIADTFSRAHSAIAYV